MRFEERELPSYAEPISSTDLQEGEIYFSVNFVDDEMLIPTMETVVFIGKDLEPEDSGQVYFQDIDSYRSGVRYESATEEDYAEFFAGSESQVHHVFTFEKALEALMKCSLRRRSVGGDMAKPNASSP